jgi:calcineurin-like phosphoesterase family protein
MSETLFFKGRDIFFTSDLHFCHNKDFLYGPRGFSSVDDHDETIIKNWNATVGPNDIVFVLGDITMGSDRKSGLEKINRLNGKIVICRGNHDTDNKMSDYWNECRNIDQRLMNHETYANIIKIGKWSFYVCHYPTFIGDFNFIKPGHKKFCLHGHTHSEDKFQFLQYCCYNVALNAHNNCPVNVKVIQSDLIEEMQKLRKEHMQNAQ